MPQIVNTYTLGHTNLQHCSYQTRMIFMFIFGVIFENTLSPLALVDVVVDKASSMLTFILRTLKDLRGTSSFLYSLC